MKIIKGHLSYQDQKTNLMLFLPDHNQEVKKTFAVFTHGYTSDKSSILNWNLRLTEVGVPSALFDLPGHYLGNYSEVSDFNYFKKHAHELFLQSFNELKRVFIEEFPLYDEYLSSSELKLVFGGHSLGAMLSLKALMAPELDSLIEKRSVCVGIGMAPKDVVHLFDTPFYKSTLLVREQLVSKALCSENVFPWIKEEKNDLPIFDRTIHLISGEDDLVVGEDGMERFMANLVTKRNIVTIEKPTKLPHHEPQLAASHVKKYLKKIGWI